MPLDKYVSGHVIFYFSIAPTKSKKTDKRFYIQKNGHFAKINTIPVIFLYTKIKTLYFTQFFMKILNFSFIYKNHDTLRYMTFLCTKPHKFLQKQDNFCYFFIYKKWTFCVTRFFIKFLKLAEGEGHFYMQKNALCVTSLYPKIMHLELCF